jgi:type II secretory pathway pseudopilin PulG
MTLVELLVAMVLFTLLSTAAFAGFSSISSANRKVDDRSLALVEVRQALELMIRDIRAADPIDPRTPVSDYDTTVGFNVYCSQPGVNGCGANRLRPLRYTLAGHGLQRVAGSTVTFIGPSGPSSLPLALQRSAIVNTAAQPVFSYYDAKGVRLVTTGTGAVPATNFQNCARRVEIHLVVRAESGNPSSRIDLRTTVDLRNYHEVKQCTATP